MKSIEKARINVWIQQKELAHYKMNWPINENRPINNRLGFQAYDDLRGDVLSLMKMMTSCS